MLRAPLAACTSSGGCCASCTRRPGQLGGQPQKSEHSFTVMFLRNRSNVTIPGVTFGSMSSYCFGCAAKFVLRISRYCTNSFNSPLLLLILASPACQHSRCFDTLDTDEGVEADEAEEAPAAPGTSCGAALGKPTPTAVRASSRDNRRSADNFDTSTSPFAIDVSKVTSPHQLAETGACIDSI